MELSDELKAVKVTLEKWEKLRDQIMSMNRLTSKACGFCDLYPCVSDRCPASERCHKISIIYDAQTTISVEITKNISWLKKRRTMLKKKIKVKSDAD